MIGKNLTVTQWELKKMLRVKVPGWPDIKLLRYYEEVKDWCIESEMQTKDWCVKNIKPDWIIIDCGANIGYYTILFAELAYLGEVYAIEPTSTMDMLRDNVVNAGIGHTWLQKFAVGAKTGRFTEPIYRIWGYPPEVVEWDFITIDDFAKKWMDNPARIDLIKIDVDSFDFEALQGAEETLKTFNPWIIVELNDALILRGHSREKALNWLRDRGYDQYWQLDAENFVMRRA